MPRALPRSALILVIALVLAGVVPAARPRSAAAADAPADIAAAEQTVLGLINRDRAAAGLVPVLLDPRLAAIARARSVDMATYGYFGHTQPNGLKVFDILTATAIAWYGAGEILASNNYPSLADSATAANDGWIGSIGHRGIILSPDYNYVGLGVAEDGAGNKIWTGVFIKGPDRTGAWARVGTPVRGTTSTLTHTARVALSWRGGDVRLSVLTSGLASFQVQRRMDRGSWSTVVASTTSTSLSWSLSLGHAIEFRVRARDRAGNVGSWTSPVGINL